MGEGPFDYGSCDDPRKLMCYLQKDYPSVFSERKIRLWLCALNWCNLPEIRERTRHPHLLTKLERATRLSEQVCDGVRTWGEVPHSMYGVKEDNNPPYRCLMKDYSRDIQYNIERNIPRQLQADLVRSTFGDVKFPDHKLVGGSLHEVVWVLHGMHLYPTPHSEPVTWLTPTVVSLAESAYDLRLNERECWSCRGKGTHLGAGPDRGNPECEECWGIGKLDDGCLDPVRLMVLGDALEEAGCADSLVAELRSSIARYRGFYVLDLILKKS